MRRLIVVLTCATALMTSACEKKTGEDEAGLANLPKGPAAAAPAPVEAAKGEAADAGPEVPPERQEPVATPARESLKLLAEKGAPEVRSIRAERTEMYGLFSIVQKEEKNRTNEVLKAAQAFTWDESPEALAAAPEKLAAVLTAAQGFAAEFKKLGEEQMAEVSAMNKENEERVAQKKSPKHNAVKIDKAQRRASYTIKLARYAGLLVRSLLDEARLYARLGSLAMREDLRARLGHLKGEDLGFEQTNLAAQRLLWELHVEGIEEPSDD